MAARIVALVTAYNEERLIANCVEHLARHGVEVYLIDNGSTDRTAAIARGYLGRGVTAIESLARDGTFRWQEILRRKEELAAALDADWFINVDADEFHLPPAGAGRLADAVAAVDAVGCNAVEFTEFTFLPTAEAPDHDHPDYLRTMRWYYPFVPRPLHLMRAWKKPRKGRAEFGWSGGHHLRLPELRLAPVPFPMKHYLCLGRAHLLRKYVERRFDPAELARGWHGWRARLDPTRVVFPRQAELRDFRGDDRLDPSCPRTRHFFHELLRPAAAATSRG
jgi:hypothetical protein